MLTSSQKAFIRQWEEQREGPKWKYYLQYSVAWTFVAFFCIFFPAKLFFPDTSFLGSIGLLVLIVIAVILGILLTHLIFTSNERKYAKLRDKIIGGNGRENLN